MCEYPVTRLTVHLRVWKIVVDPPMVTVSNQTACVGASTPSCAPPVIRCRTIAGISLRNIAWWAWRSKWSVSYVLAP